jgi:protein-serine/threonine kinase
MSLDKFGLAKLLGQSNSSEVDLPRQSYIPTSKHNKSHSMYQAPSQAATISSSTTPADVKKARRRTLQLLSGRTASPESSNGSATVAPVVGPQGIRPAADHSSQSAASMVTVDRDTEPPRAPSGNPAKRVIDWFRRKSAKDQLSTIQAGQTTGSVRTTSGGTMGRIPVHADRDRTHQSVSAATRTRVSLDYPAHYEPTSVAPTADAGPIIVIQEEKEDKEASKAKENAKPAVETKAGPEFTRQPLAPASSKANMEPKPLSGTSKLQVRTPERVAPSRSKSQRVPPTSASSPIASAAATAAIAGATGAVPRGEEGKLRLHTGLVDQSALSSRPPAEIMAEVKDVLHKMGIDVKEEAEYRLRCTRVRRRKGGPTTGLSTGFARVTAMGSSTSVNRPGAGAENRIPASPSGGLAGGLKGMLLRRGSSYSSSTMPRTDSDGASTLVAGTPASVVLAASTATATTTAPTAATSAAIQTLYGEHSIDNGDEVKFVVELCRIKNLNGLYLLSIKRLRGSVWSFKFIYQTIVERCDTLTH